MSTDLITIYLIKCAQNKGVPGAGHECWPLDPYCMSVIDQRTMQCNIRAIMRWSPQPHRSVHAIHSDTTFPVRINNRMLNFSPLLAPCLHSWELLPALLEILKRGFDGSNPAGERPSWKATNYRLAFLIEFCVLMNRVGTQRIIVIGEINFQAVHARASTVD